MLFYARSPLRNLPAGGSAEGPRERGLLWRNTRSVVSIILSGEKMASQPLLWCYGKMLLYTVEDLSLVLV